MLPKHFSAPWKSGLRLLKGLTLLAGLTTAYAASAAEPAPPGPSYATAVTMQRLLHWKQMPVRVYFTPGGAATEERRRQVIAGFDEWVQATDGAVSYRVVDTPRADITVTIAPDSSVPGRQGAAGDTSVMFTHTELKSADMELAAGHTTPNQLQEVAAHEFGHALGIDGHSDNPDDLMAPVELRVYDPYGMPVDAPAHAVTRRDLNTLRACYGPLLAVPARPRLATQEAGLVSADSAGTDTRRDSDRDSETIEPAAPAH